MAFARDRAGQRGQGLVETALVLPVIILIFLGIFDFGRAIFFYNAVSEAARNGSRIASVNQTSSDICQVVSERAAGIALPTTCAPNATAVGTWHVNSCGAGQSLECNQLVRVNYRFTAITPIISGLIGPINLTSTSQVITERRCPPLLPNEAACPRT